MHFNSNWSLPVTKSVNIADFPKYWRKLKHSSGLLIVFLRNTKCVKLGQQFWKYSKEFTSHPIAMQTKGKKRVDLCSYVVFSRPGSFAHPFEQTIQISPPTPRKRDLNKTVTFDPKVFWHTSMFGEDFVGKYYDENVNFLMRENRSHNDDRKVTQLGLQKLSRGGRARNI